jgi:hypothetical protein
MQQLAWLTFGSALPASLTFGGESRPLLIQQRFPFPFLETPSNSSAVTHVAQLQCFTIAAADCCREFRIHTIYCGISVLLSTF